MITVDFTNIILLLGIILGTSAHRIVTKSYTRRTKNGAFIFSALNIGSAIIIYLLSGGMQFDFPPALWIYIGIFVAVYLTAALCTLQAIAEGSLALTSLIVAYAPVVPTVYGLLFLGEALSVTLILGILFLAVSLILINLKKGEGTVKITLRWLILVVLALIGTGGKSTMIKIQQMDFDGLYKNAFLVISFGVSSFVCLVIALFAEKGRIKTNVRLGGLLGVSCGLLTGTINLCTSLLSAPARNMPASVMFPMISAGGIICSLLVASFIFKEKLSKMQLLGLFMGVVSVICVGI